jgi:hypothetical protein
MRALIRGELHPDLDVPALLSDEPEAYVKRVVDLFAAMNFDAKAIGKDVLDRDETKAITDHIPKDIKDEELKHPILLGYISDGQVHFLVCAVNQRDLHIRLQAPLFLRLRRGCAELVHKTSRLRFRRQLFDAIPFVRRKQPYIILYRTIQVLEPQRDEPTIEGTIIGSPLLAATRQSSHASLTAVIVAGLAIVLFFYSRSLSPLLQSWLPKHLPETYAESALERISTALLVTAFVAALGVFLRFLELWRTKPIEWDFLVGSRPSRTTRAQ